MIINKLLEPRVNYRQTKNNEPINFTSTTCFKYYTLPRSNAWKDTIKIITKIEGPRRQKFK